MLIIGLTGNEMAEIVNAVLDRWRRRAPKPNGTAQE